MDYLILKVDDCGNLFVAGVSGVFRSNSGFFQVVAGAGSVEFFEDTAEIFWVVKACFKGNFGNRQFG